MFILATLLSLDTLVMPYLSCQTFAGYTLRHLHESRVDQRLESIEKAVSFHCRIMLSHNYFTISVQKNKMCTTQEDFWSAIQEGV